MNLTGIISKKEALSLWKKAPWTELAAAAHRIKLQKHKNKVSYTIFQIINYTNVCDIKCSFCSYNSSYTNKAYTLSLAQIKKQTAQAKERGAVGIFFQGGVNPQISLDYYLNALQIMSAEFPVRAFSPVELFYMAKNNKMPLNELLELLKKAGLSSVPGAGAEIMTENMRKVLAPKKLSAKDWCKVMEQCHNHGLKSSANIVIGSSESSEDIVEHLNYVRELQDRTGGFQSFIPWVFQPQTKNFPIRSVQSVEYIKLVALCRLFFHGIPNIEVSVLGMGKVLGELALNAGANDISSVVLEERVMRSQGITSAAEAGEFITQAGFKAVMRGINY